MIYRVVFFGMLGVLIWVLVQSLHTGLTVTAPPASDVPSVSNPNELLAIYLPLVDDAPVVPVDIDVPAATMTGPEPALAERLQIGMDDDVVRTRIGLPLAAERQGRLWTYDGLSVLFDDDKRVVGWTESGTLVASDRIGSGSVFAPLTNEERAESTQQAGERPRARSTTSRRSRSSARSTSRRREVDRYATNTRMRRNYRPNRLSEYNRNRARLTANWLYRTSRRATTPYLDVNPLHRRNDVQTNRGERYRGRFTTTSTTGAGRARREMNERFRRVRNDHIRGR